MSIIQNVHSQLVFSRRTKVLSKHMSSLFPKDASVLDVGCGDGTIDTYLMNLRPDIKIVGVDILKRKKTLIPVTLFDGKKLPFPDKSFDSVVFIDVLHHTSDPKIILNEAKRVSRNSIIIKDHYSNNPFQFITLKFMDWVGNKSYGVNLPYNYLNRSQWETLYRDLQLSNKNEIKKLGLYGFPFNLIFENGIQFISQLDVRS